MDRKIIALLIFLTIVCATSAVSAEDLKNVTISDVTFNIPDGFSEDKSNEIINETVSESGVTYVQNAKLFEKGNDVIVMLVSDYDGYDVTEDIIKSLGGTEKTINNVSGTIKDDSGFKVFSYEKNGKLAVISLTDEKYLEDIIV